jgi:hypothetical protein
MASCRPEGSRHGLASNPSTSMQQSRCRGCVRLRPSTSGRRIALRHCRATSRSIDRSCTLPTSCARVRPFCERSRRARACPSHGHTATCPHRILMLILADNRCRPAWTVPLALARDRTSLLCAEHASGGWAWLRSLAGDPAGARATSGWRLLHTLAANACADGGREAAIRAEFD